MGAGAVVGEAARTVTDGTRVGAGVIVGDAITVTVGIGVAVRDVVGVGIGLAAAVAIAVRVGPVAPPPHAANRTVPNPKRKVHNQEERMSRIIWTSI